MKLLFDENLSPRLTRSLGDLFPDSVHVHHCGLGSADDEQVWRYAAANDYLLVSKDVDFHDRSVLTGAPPTLIWVRTGNCSTATIEDVLRRNTLLIRRFCADPRQALLILR